MQTPSYNIQSNEDLFGFQKPGQQILSPRSSRVAASAAMFETHSSVPAAFSHCLDAKPKKFKRSYRVSKPKELRGADDGWKVTPPPAPKVEKKHVTFSVDLPTKDPTPFDDMKSEDPAPLSPPSNSDNKVLDIIRKRREAALNDLQRREATRIQAVVRGVATRITYQKALQRISSAIRIQAFLRGSLQRLKFLLVVMDHRMHMAEERHKARLQAIDDRCTAKADAFRRKEEQKNALGSFEASKNKTECVKMIKYMRKQNNELRIRNKKLRDDMRRVFRDNCELEQMIKATEEAIEQVKGYEQKLLETRAKIEPVEKSYRERLPEMKNILEERRNWCMSELKLKTMYSGCMEKIANEVSERYKVHEDDLVEKILLWTVDGYESDGNTSDDEPVEWCPQE